MAICLSRCGWARMWLQEKKASIEIHRLGTLVYVRKNDLLNFQNFVGHFLIDHLQYPTRSACLEIHGFQICQIQMMYPTDKNSWVPFQRKVLSVPNSPRSRLSPLYPVYSAVPAQTGTSHRRRLRRRAAENSRRRRSCSVSSPHRRIHRIR